MGRWSAKHSRWRWPIVAPATASSTTLIQGRQYADRGYQRVLQAHGMIPSMSRKGDCFDNACAESFFSTLKNELVHHHTFHTREEARTAIFEYIEVFYNRERLHQTLDYLAPAEYERRAGVPI